MRTSTQVLVYQAPDRTLVQLGGSDGSTLAEVVVGSTGYVQLALGRWLKWPSAPASLLGGRSRALSYLQLLLHFSQVHETRNGFFAEYVTRTLPPLLAQLLVLVPHAGTVSEETIGIPYVPEAPAREPLVISARVRIHRGFVVSESIEGRGRFGPTPRRSPQEVRASLDYTQIDTSPHVVVPKMVEAAHSGVPSCRPNTITTVLRCMGI